MEQERFRDWFWWVDELTAAQRKEVATALSGPPEGAALLAAIGSAGLSRGAKRSAFAASDARSVGRPLVC